MGEEFCLTVSDSGNYTVNLNRILAQSGYVFETVSTPAKISRGNCGLSIKFPRQYMETIINMGIEHRLPVRKVYEIFTVGNHAEYERIY